jgi:hypothetical protein
MLCISLVNPGAQVKIPNVVLPQARVLDTAIHQAPCLLCCSKIAEAEAAMSVNEKKWLVMHMHVQRHASYSIHVDMRHASPCPLVM